MSSSLKRNKMEFSAKRCRNLHVFPALIIFCLLLVACVQCEENLKGCATGICFLSASQSLTTLRHRERRASMSSVWSSWSSWSSCSRSCGGGASFRTRHCLSRIPLRYMTKALTCPGDRRQYRSCNIKDCPKDQLDFRSAQCAVFNQRDGQGNLIREWLPVYNAHEECELVCHTSDGAYMYTFGRVLDGTRCRFRDRDMCISGKCYKVGCDGELYSNLTEDSCGVCGGRNDTCGYVKNIYMDEYPVKGYYTYNKIGSIPAGATHIRIKDKSGLNYIALKDEENNFILNGDWTISWPGSYQAAGTSFKYDRERDGLENVVAEGPINRSVNVMIMFRERNPGVEFEYWLPPEPKKKNQEYVVNYDNEIEMLPVIPDAHGKPEKKTFGTIDPVKKPVTPYQGNPQSQSPSDNEVLPETETVTDKRGKKRKGERDKKKSRKEKCGKCKRVKGRARHYCKSSFVLLIDVVSETKINGETRYEVVIEKTFKNEIHLNRREYLWVINACSCPKLRRGGRYIVTGNRTTSSNTGESRLTLARENLVVKYKPGLETSWDRLVRKERTICKKYE